MIQELNLPNALGPGKILYVNETGSTMLDAALEARNGCPHGTVICAGHQSAGRGRVAIRRWDDNPGESLMFTAVLHKNRFPEMNLFPLRIGLGLALWLEDLKIGSVMIRWPNDVLVDDKKLSGILCESRAEFYLCGIGINVKQKAFPDYATSPTSLNLLGVRGEPLDFLPRLLSFLSYALEIPDPLPDLTRRLHGRGTEAVFYCGPVGSRESVTGIIDGIDGSGQLILRTPSGSRLFGAGELSSRQ
jgi:BirA family biotin operon repressor/biotin-[acetyl-CoA-carboxylase] ligase